MSLNSTCLLEAGGRGGLLFGICFGGDRMADPASLDYCSIESISFSTRW
jgi:hypothetical protein